MEILYNEQKGIPLADDPVFQYLKSNRIAREMMVKPGEAFTVETIIDKALRQDIDPDPTMARKHKDYHDKSEIYIDQTRRDFVNDDSYIYGIQELEEILELPPGGEIEHKEKKDWRIQRKLDELTWETEKPPAFLNRPLNKEEARRKYMRKITKHDINWKDTALLTQFLNRAGKIKNRYQSRLSDSVQNHLATTISHARQMQLIPSAGNIRPTDKLSLKSFYEDLEEYNRKSIDPFTGKLYMRGEINYTNPEDSDQLGYTDKFTKSEEMAKDPKGTKVDQEKLNGLIVDQVGFIPSTKQLQWMEAQAYAKEQRDNKTELDEKSGRTKEKVDKKGVDSSESKYRGIQDIKIEANIDDLPNYFIHEKSYNVSKLDTDKTELTYGLSSIVEEVKESEDQINQNIEKIMAKYREQAKPYSDVDYSEYKTKPVEPIADNEKLKNFV